VNSFHIDPKARSSPAKHCAQRLRPAPRHISRRLVRLSSVTSGSGAPRDSTSGAPLRAEGDVRTAAPPPPPWETGSPDGWLPSIARSPTGALLFLETAWVTQRKRNVTWPTLRRCRRVGAGGRILPAPPPLRSAGAGCAQPVAALPADAARRPGPHPKASQPCRSDSPGHHPGTLRRSRHDEGSWCRGDRRRDYQKPAASGSAVPDEAVLASWQDNGDARARRANPKVLDQSGDLLPQCILNRQAR